MAQPVGDEILEFYCKIRELQMALKLRKGIFNAWTHWTDASAMLRCHHIITADIR